MGQVALGIRSLLIKAAVFFVMCALLVWALGGQLFPAPEVVDRPSVEFDGSTWFWRLYAGGDEPNAMHWELMVKGDGKPEPFHDQRWVDAAALMVVGNSLYFAAERSPGPEVGAWLIGRVDQHGAFQSVTYDSRLALEQALEDIRSGHGLPDHSPEPAEANGSLDTGSGTADETDSSLRQ